MPGTLSIPRDGVTIACPLFAPVTWSMANPTQQVPYHLWLVWAAAHVYPKPPDDYPGQH